MSPKLFEIYVDDLTQLLIKSKIACILHEVCFNHLFNEDDLLSLGTLYDCLAKIT